MNTCVNGAPDADTQRSRHTLVRPPQACAGRYRATDLANAPLGSHSVPCTVATLGRWAITGNHSATLSYGQPDSGTTKKRLAAGVFRATQRIASRSALDTLVSVAASAPRSGSRIIAASVEYTTKNPATTVASALVRPTTSGRITSATPSPASNDAGT